MAAPGEESRPRMAVQRERRDAVYYVCGGGGGGGVNVAAIERLRVCGVQKLDMENGRQVAPPGSGMKLLDRHQVPACAVRGGRQGLHRLPLLPPRVATRHGCRPAALVGTGSVGGNVSNLHASIIKRREYITNDEFWCII